MTELRVAILFAALAFGGTTGRAESGQSVDLLIINARIVDGTGAAARTGAIGVRGSRIVYVGNGDTPLASAQILDAKGAVVAPGFIDAHSHVLDNAAQKGGPSATDHLLAQGVTTLVAGPDGNWSPREIDRTFAVTAGKIAVNYACYVGHNGIRREVMPGVRIPASAQQINKMKRLVRKGMRMGCVGLSTGLMYDPGMFSDTAEVIALTRAVRPFGGIYDSHTRDPGFQMLASEQEAIDIGRAAGVPVKLAHLKATGLINKGRIGEVITIVEQARGEGHEVVADQYPFDGAAIVPLIQLFVDERGERFSPARLGELRAALADPARRAAIAAASEKGVAGGFAWVKSVGYANMRIVHAPHSPQLLDANLELLARQQGKPTFDLIADLLQPEFGPVLITLGTIDEADVQALLVKPWVMIASDGGGWPGALHPRSTASYARVIEHYVGKLRLLTLEEAVRRMTLLPANHLGFAGRGVISEGAVADLVMFDPAKIRANASYAEPDRLATGMDLVLVNGQIAWRNGKATGAQPGQFVKRAQRRPD